jgi:hypothetical protein
MDPEADDEQEEREWVQLGMDEFFRGYAESDSIYDDPDESDSAERPTE